MGLYDRRSGKGGLSGSTSDRTAVLSSYSTYISNKDAQTFAKLFVGGMRGFGGILEYVGTLICDGLTAFGHKLGCVAARRSNLEKFLAFVARTYIIPVVCTFQRHKRPSNGLENIVM
ncbi:hypothetical protein L204_106440 [Cryptococcus depauperatus]